MPGFVRRLSNDTEQGEADCREFARRAVLPRDRHSVALQFASTFWLTAMVGALGLVVVCAVDAVNHFLVGSAPVLGILAVFTGLMGLSAISALIAGTRRRWLDEPLVRRYSRREVPGLATPKPYDLVISVIAGVLAGVALWAGVAEGIAAANG